jgi:hypothetical protein
MIKGIKWHRFAGRAIMGFVVRTVCVYRNNTTRFTRERRTFRTFEHGEYVVSFVNFFVESRKNFSKFKTEPTE